MSKLYSCKNLFLFLLLPFLLFSSITSQAQDIAIGHWRHHLPNRIVVSLAEKEGKIFGATPYGLLEYNKEDNSISKRDKVSGLSDFGITAINYSQAKNLLVMGYQNGNIDILQNDKVISIPDIRQANILGSKSIDNIYFSNDLAYLSCRFGIVVLDLNLFVILDTWFIGPEGSMLNVSALTLHENIFFAATEAGLLKAAADAPNLADYQYWQRVEELPVPAGNYTHVLVHNGKLLANLNTPEADTLYILSDENWNAFAPQTYYDFYPEKTNIRSDNGFLTLSSMRGVFVFNQDLELSTEIYWYLKTRVLAYDALIDKEGILWVGDRSMGLVKRVPGSGFESIIPNSPSHAESFGLAHNGTTLWVAPGAILGGWQSTYNDRGIFLLHNNNWKSFNRWEFPEIDAVRDIHSVTPDPRNPNRVFAAAWSGGLLEFDQQEGLITLYNEENSTLQKRANANDIIRVGGSAWDSKGNLWVSNSDADHFLSVRKADGTWLSFPHNGNVAGNESLGKVVVDNADQKWVAMPRGGGIIVFKEDNLENNGSFSIRKLTGQSGNGSLPSTRVSTLVKDKDGYIWVGTNAGVVVFYSPQQALRGQAFDAQSIIVVQDGFAGRLFENEIINTIFVDGSNKKWFGTVGSGALLLSADGRETIQHFNTANSPLPSNNILDISVDPQTGEVFFATDRGLVSYRGFATEGQRQHTNVLAFPNPVRPGYNGYIAVKGLVTNARVKITDINANLIHDSYAEGGQLIWDGFDLNGRKPSSGIYLVFSTDPEGNETMVTKIMFLK